MVAVTVPPLQLVQLCPLVIRLKMLIEIMVTKNFKVFIIKEFGVSS